MYFVNLYGLVVAFLERSFAYFFYRSKMDCVYGYFLLFVLQP